MRADLSTFPRKRLVNLFTRQPEFRVRLMGPAVEKTRDMFPIPVDILASVTYHRLVSECDVGPLGGNWWAAPLKASITGRVWGKQCPLLSWRIVQNAVLSVRTAQSSVCYSWEALSISGPVLPSRSLAVRYTAGCSDGTPDCPRSRRRRRL